MSWTYEQLYSPVACAVCGNDMDSYTINNNPSETVCMRCMQENKYKLYLEKTAKEEIDYIKRLEASEEYLEKQISFHVNLRRRVSTRPSGHCDGDLFRDVFGSKSCSF